MNHVFVLFILVIYMINETSMFNVRIDGLKNNYPRMHQNRMRVTVLQRKKFLPKLSSQFLSSTRARLMEEQGEIDDVAEEQQLSTTNKGINEMEMEREIDH